MLNLTRRDRGVEARPPGEVQPGRARGRFLDPTAVGVLAAIVSLAGSSRPSFWYDEAATISASVNRSLPEMMRMLGHIDAVHGLYYLVMRGWFVVFPATEFWSRASSGVAVAVAAAGVVVLAKRFSTRSVAACAGVAFAILPRTTWAGMEARSYALSAVAAVWVTVLFVAAVRRTKTWLWPLYAILLLLSVLLNAYLILLVAVHGAILALLHAELAAVLRWAATSFAVIAGAAPFLVVARRQLHQVRWIPPLKSGTIHDVLVTQYFDHGDVCAIAAGVIIAAAVVIWVAGVGRLEDGERRLLIITLVWIGLPTAVVLLYSAMFEPLYFPRYLTFTAPAMAILLGICIAAVGRAPLRMAGLLTLLAVAAMPNYLVVQRGPYAKEGMDYSQVADLITERAAPGDCLVMDNTITWKPGPIRAMMAARPAAYQKLLDPGRGPSAASVGRLWDGHLAIWGIPDKIDACTVLWIVSERDKTQPDHDSGTRLSAGTRFEMAPAYRIPQALGFRLVERWQFNFAQVTKAIR